MTKKMAGQPSNVLFFPTFPHNTMATKEELREIQKQKILGEVSGTDGSKKLFLIKKLFDFYDVDKVWTVTKTNTLIL